MAHPCWEPGAAEIPMWESWWPSGAVRECGPVTLLEPDEVPDDALVMPIAMMGAPRYWARKPSANMNTRICTRW